LAAELITEILKKQLLAAIEMPDVKDARSYLDSLVIDSGALAKVNISNEVLGTFRGSWFVPKVDQTDCVILFLHGGGYAFYPRGFYDNLSAVLALSTKANVFTLDYRLTPEHRFPAQRIDATAAYLWLVKSGLAPSNLIVLGDSAGGNLTLSLLLFLRDERIPLPALGVCLSPATNFGLDALEAIAPDLDWITPQMAIRWADWFCCENERCLPLVSPLHADLRGLPPLYIQAGGAEILLPSIESFVEEAKRQGADVSLDVWPEMNHDFQAFGYDVPQSAEALHRISEVIAGRLSTSNRKITSSRCCAGGIDA
jgi:acetyl esterase/lipase